MKTVAALFVDPAGVYSTYENVDCWDESRDARNYAGPHPVVAHPPCSRWCRLAGLVEARWGHKRGEDDGCFKSALAAVRTWGGILEHPAYSAAWPAFGLPKPQRHGRQRGFCGGWSAHVEQGRYGHVAKKATWLYAFRAKLCDLAWGSVPDSDAAVSWCGNALISKCANHTQADDTRRRITGREAAATPTPFADLLVSMARSVT